MIISNRSHIDTSEIVSIVKKIPNLPDDVYCIVKKNQKDDYYSGTAYRNPKPSIKHEKCRYTIIVRISTVEKHYPMKNFGFSNGKCYTYGGCFSPRITYNTWQECMLGVIAHELEHINQYRDNKPVSEYRCEQAAYRAINRM